MGILKSLKEYGKLRANRYAEATNSLKLSNVDCDCSDLESCMYRIAFKSSADDFESLTVTDRDGFAQTLTSSAGYNFVDDMPAIKTLIYNFLVSLGLFDIYIDSSEDVVGGHYSVYIISALPITAGVSSSNTATITSGCVIQYRCNYKISQEGATVTVTYGNDSEDLANGTYDYTGVALTDTATAATLKSDWEDVLTALSLRGTVSVTVNNTAGNFSVEIDMVSGLLITLGSSPLIPCDCYEWFELA